jgi:hypothetical protein
MVSVRRVYGLRAELPQLPSAPIISSAIFFASAQRAGKWRAPPGGMADRLVQCERPSHEPARVPLIARTEDSLP